MSSPDSRRPIGVFDSGVGGLTVVRALRARLPGEDVVYLGDTARVPYGNRSPRTVERYSLGCQAFLLARDVKLVLIACNTASATALPALREASTEPVIGAVEPGAASALAATRNGHIGVIGTRATVRSGAYDRALGGARTDVRVSSLACPLFVPLAEEGWTEAADDVARTVARRYLAELFENDRDIDTIVLGCTHYPLLRGVITETARELSDRDIAIVDSATAMAEAAAAQLAVVSNERKHAGKLACFATDISRLDEIAPRFLGEPITSFELVDL
jgi:glutamate racemase